MKAFLIFLAVAFPVVLASPSFWSLVRMEWDAERVGYVDEGGTTQWAMLGPKAAWPGWAVVPPDAKLTIRANFEGAPGHSAMGYGEIAGQTSAKLVVQRYQDALQRAGWTVRAGRFDASSPDIPPRPIHWCIVQGSQGGRVQMMQVDIDDTRTVGRLHWSEGKMPFPIGAKAEDCWPK